MDFTGDSRVAINNQPPTGVRGIGVEEGSYAGRNAAQLFPGVLTKLGCITSC